MSKIIWCDDFSIHNEQLDTQHQEIFKIANEADDIVAKIQNNFEKDDEENLKKIIYKIFNYIKFHFKDEENFMRKVNYPFLEDHIKLHKDLINKTKQLLNHSTDLPKIAEELSKLTKFWILKHICTDDLLLENYLKKVIHIGEIHYSPDQYINLKKITTNPNIEQEYHFSYICHCDSKIHQIPQSIHEELLKEKSILRCTSCKKVLFFLKSSDKNIEEEINFDYFKKRFENVSKQVGKNI